MEAAVKDVEHDVDEGYHFVDHEVGDATQYIERKGKEIVKGIGQLSDAVAHGTVHIWHDVSSWF